MVRWGTWRNLRAWAMRVLVAGGGAGAMLYAALEVPAIPPLVWLVAGPLAAWAFVVSGVRLHLAQLREELPRSLDAQVARAAPDLLEVAGPSLVFVLLWGACWIPVSGNPAAVAWILGASFVVFQGWLAMVSEVVLLGRDPLASVGRGLLVSLFLTAFAPVAPLLALGELLRRGRTVGRHALTIGLFSGLVALGFVGVMVPFLFLTASTASGITAATRGAILLAGSWITGVTVAQTLDVTVGIWALHYLAANAADGLKLPTDARPRPPGIPGDAGPGKRRSG